MNEELLRQKILVDEMYSILTKSEDIPWPSRYTKENKIEYLELLIENLEELEHYDKCAPIKTLLQKIQNE